MSAHSYDICINAGGIVERSITMDGALRFAAAMRDSIIDADVICFVVPYHTTAYIASVICQDGVVTSVHVGVNVDFEADIGITSSIPLTFIDLRGVVDSGVGADGNIPATLIAIGGAASSDIAIRAAANAITKVIAPTAIFPVGVSGACDNTRVDVLTGLIDHGVGVDADDVASFAEHYEKTQSGIAVHAITADTATIRADMRADIALHAAINAISGRYRLLGETDPYTIGEIDRWTIGELDFETFDEGW